MLKIGLKKKKKNKKGKKNEELFTEEELEKYRKEHAQKVVEEAGPSDEAKPAAQSEEFEKFNQLTAGVDDILKKTQGDLDRIKKDSFFQRKLTPSQLKAQEEQEKAEREKSEGNWVGFEEGKRKETDEQNQETHLEFEDSGSDVEFEENDDIFDTAYVDVLESGEIKLAHVPDDDELGFNDGPDPFDTTTADQLLRRAEEEERQKKKQVSLGLAVNVLTGRADRDKALLDDQTEEKQAEAKKVRTRPRKIQDLCLLGSFDESSKSKSTEPPPQADVPSDSALKSLLDDDFAVDEELPEGDELITQVLVNQVAQPPSSELATPTEPEPNFDEVVKEFELGPAVDLEIKKLEEEEEFDEFSALAASSVVNQKLEDELKQYEAEEDDPFDTSVVNSVLQFEQDHFESVERELKHLPVQVPQGNPVGWSEFDEPVEVDPFDTSFADQCAPGKVELRLLEKEILGAPDVPLVIKKIDIHLEARILSRNNSEDFNPREGEEFTGRRPAQQKVSIHITDPSGETQRGSESEDIVALNLSHRDLLGGSTTDLASLADQPLPPATNLPCDELSRYSDPFDTSLADQVSAPGKVELRFIEKELLSDLKSDQLSDDDFDPRGDDKSTKGVSFDIPSPIVPDLLASVREETGARPLTPFYADPTSAESDLDTDDPFDTSHVTHLPGKQELKLIEQELEQVTSISTVQPLHEILGIVPEVGVGLKKSTSDQDFNPRAEEPQLIVQSTPNRRYSDISGLQNQPSRALPLRSSFSDHKPDLLAVEEELPDKPLTPALEEDVLSYIDPFDTTIAENIAPGKAELKLLEVELVGSISRSYTDPDFNPRDNLNSTLKTIPSTQPLQPLDLTAGQVEDEEEIDPFDTSIANNIAPGKAELRLLESELVGQ